MPKKFSSALRPVRARRRVDRIAESLETRQLLSMSLNAAGWTVITPPAGAHVIYCSNSGNDSNTGLSPESPVRTLSRGESLLRSGTGDQLLLEAGDVFSGNFIFWTKSGQSAQNPIVLGSYGTGARPEILTGSQMGLETGSVGSPVVNYLAVMGINFIASGRDPNMTSKPATGANPSAIEILTKSTGILVENCEFQYYTVDLTFQDYLGPISNVTVRRNTIIDAYSGNTHAQGLYATGVTNLTIQGNLFDQNGYNTQLGIPATVFNQDCYLAYDDVNCVVEDNIFSRAASTGLEDRPGGIVKDNVFIDDPVGMTFGLVNGARTTKGGVSGSVTGNVFIGGGNLPNLPQGQAIQVGNIKAGSGTTISGNMFTQGGANGAPAVTLEAGKSQIDPQDSVGINDLTLTGNVFNQWSTGIDLVLGLTPGGRGITALNRVTITNNEFENLTIASIENHAASYSSQETISGNEYYNANHWLVNDAIKPAVGTVMSKPFAFPDAGASIATYDKAIGNAGGSVADFLSHAAQFFAGNWDTNYGADAVVGYFEEAFDLPKTVSTTTTPTPPPTTPPTTPTPPTTVSTPPTGVADSASIAADSYSAKHGTIVGAASTGIGTNGGAWTEYAKVNFGSGVTNISASIAAVAKYAGSIQLRLDSPTGTLVGTLKIAGTGSYSKYVTQSTSVKGATGVHNLYLVFTGGGGTGNIASFNFTAPSTATATKSATSTILGATYNAKSGSIVSAGGTAIGTNGGSWAAYSQIDFGTGVTTFKASIAVLAKYAGTIQLRLNSPTGALISTMKIAGTGSYTKYLTQTAAVKGATGVHNLYLIFTGNGGTGNIASFTFS